MNLLVQHPAIVAIAAYWTFSALVGGMPAPKETSSGGYTWAYNSLHILAGNLTAAVATKFPQATQTLTVTTTTPAPKE